MWALIFIAAALAVCVVRDIARDCRND